MRKDNKRIRTFVKRFVNPNLRNAARLPYGPFALIRYVGRKSGKTKDCIILKKHLLFSAFCSLFSSVKQQAALRSCLLGHLALTWQVEFDALPITAP